MLKQLLALGALMAYCNTVLGLYFHIPETKRKCLIEDVPDHTAVMVRYKVELYDPRLNGIVPSLPGIGIHLEVRNSDDKIILSRVYSSSRRISFTLNTPGEHVLCMFSNSTARLNGAQLRVHFDTQVDDHDKNYISVAYKKKLAEFPLRIRQILDRAEQITKEQNYERYREERFRQTDENTNSLILWSSVTQAVLLVFVGFWQVRHARITFDMEHQKDLEEYTNAFLESDVEDSLVEEISK